MNFIEIDLYGEDIPDLQLPEIGQYLRGVESFSPLVLVYYRVQESFPDVGEIIVERLVSKKESLVPTKYKMWTWQIIETNESTLRLRKIL